MDLYSNNVESVYYLCYSDIENHNEIILWETLGIEKVTDVYDPYAYCLNYFIYGLDHGKETNKLDFELILI